MVKRNRNRSSGLPLAILVVLSLSLLSCASNADPCGARQSIRGSPSERERNEINACLNTEKLYLETTRLRNDIVDDSGDFDLAALINTIFANITILLAIIAGIWAVLKYRLDRSNQLRESQEGRFEKVVSALGSKENEERVGAAVLLARFLQREYERFYVQIFRLTAASLRLQRDKLPVKTKYTRSKVATPDPLTQTLATVFRESYALAADWVQTNDLTLWEKIRHFFLRVPIGRNQAIMQQFLNAEGVSLDHTYLGSADFRGGWFPRASFRDLTAPGVDFSEANLSESDFTGAEMVQSRFAGADIQRARFIRAQLRDAVFDGTIADGADFSDADLQGAVFRGATLVRARFFPKRDADAADTEFEGETRLRVNEAKFYATKGISRTTKMRLQRLGAIFEKG